MLACCTFNTFVFIISFAIIDALLVQAKWAVCASMILYMMSATIDTIMYTISSSLLRQAMKGIARDAAQWIKQVLRLCHRFDDLANGVVSSQAGSMHGRVFVNRNRNIIPAPVVYGTS